MKKTFLLLAVSAALLVSCNSPASGSGGGGNKISDSEIMKKAGDYVLDCAGADRSAPNSLKPFRALDPLATSDKIVYLSMPGILLYLGGVLNEAKIDVENQVFEFGGDYEFQFGTTEWTTQNIYLALNVNLNKNDGKIFLSAHERVSSNGSVVADDDVFIDLNYDFEKNECKDFELYMDQNGDYAYVKVENGEGQIRKNTTELTEAEATAIYNTYSSYKTAFATKYAQKATPTAANNKSCMEKFVATQLYANGLLNQNLPVRVKE